MNDDILYIFFCKYYFSQDSIERINEYKKDMIKSYLFCRFRLSYAIYELLKDIYYSLPKWLRKFIKRPIFYGFN
jgi:hypothetical protein